MTILRKSLDVGLYDGAPPGAHDKVEPLLLNTSEKLMLALTGKVWIPEPKEKLTSPDEPVILMKLKFSV